MKLSDYRVRLKPLARWIILVALFRAAVGVVGDETNGRNATLPVAWPQAIGQVVIGMAIILLVLWAAGMLSDLDIFSSQEDGKQ